jgi:hypothetical protein
VKDDLEDVALLAKHGVKAYVQTDLPLMSPGFAPEVEDASASRQL